MTPPPRICLTGATGFLGHHLVPELRQAGYRLRAVVRPTSDTTFLEEHDVELALVDDISDEAGLTAAFSNCQAIVHAAGQFRFWGDEEAFWQTNVVGTTAVVNACLHHPGTRLIHISTLAVAGHIPPGTLIDERHPPNPQTAYQRSKLAGEQVVLQAVADQRLEAIILRPGAFYGPWGRYAFNRLFFEEPLRGWRIRVAGGKHINFPAYVPDVAQAIRLALTNGRSGALYNICSQSISHNAANQIISDLAGIARWRLSIPQWAVITLAWGWTKLSRLTRREPFYPLNLRLYVFQDWRVNIDKARQELGFEPTPFPVGAAATLDWYATQGIGHGVRGTIEPFNP